MIIYKYPLRIIDVQYIKIPEFHKILHIGEQNGQLCLWALVDRIDVKREIKIYIFGTGHLIPYDVGPYLGSVAMSMGLVWHVFGEK
jgi:hypothetical protein